MNPLAFWRGFAQHKECPKIYLQFLTLPKLKLSVGTALNASIQHEHSRLDNE